MIQRERVFSKRTYSPTNRRAEFFTYAEDGRLMSYVDAELKTDNTLGSRLVYNYIWLGGIPVAQFKEAYSSTGVYLTAESQLVYLHADHLNTAQLGTGKSTAAAPAVNDAVIWSLSGAVYGWTWETQDPDGDGSSVKMALRFPGQIYYGMGTLNYNYYRTYDARIGRYLESDPIGLEGGRNTYSYALSNPLSYSDPSGLIGIGYKARVRSFVLNFPPPGPFGRSCGKEGSPWAQYLPDGPWATACQAHDDCYDDCSNGRPSKKECDDAFRTNGGNYLYYLGVKYGARGAFEDARAKCADFFCEE